MAQNLTDSNFDTDSNLDLKKYMEAINALAQSGSDLFFNTSGINHAAIVMSSIFENSENSVKIFSGTLSGMFSQHQDYLSALESFIASGKKLEILLAKPLIEKNTTVSKILSGSITNKNHNIFIKKISEQGLQFLRHEIGEYNFTVGDDRMYRIETDVSSRKTEGCYNDRDTSNKLSDVFNKCFQLAEEELIPLYHDQNFEKSCSIIIPDFEEINLELIEYFSRNPDALQNLGSRKFENLLDVIFRNQGYITELGPGWNDKGVDLRLIQKDTVGQILTLVQAKRYKKENAIRLDAVKALTATVDKQNANRGLFVTTSRYLPGVEKWASEQPTKIVLAKSEDIAEWCRKITQSNMSLSFK